MNMEVSKWAGDVMVTNHLQAPYSVYFTQNHTIVRGPGRRQEESYDFLSIFYAVYGARWSLGST